MTDAHARLVPLMDALGWRFKREALLALALTHPSAASGAEDNQRLEFLGDAVLQLCVSRALFARHPQMQEGQLTQLRAALVREESLACAARAFGVGAFLRLDHGEELSGGRDKPSVLADAMEAVLAAVYLDGGLEAAAAVCDRAFGDYEPRTATANYKSLLQEREQARGHSTPVYRVIGEEGPPHARAFEAEVSVDGRVLGPGRGPSKTQAEQAAARQALGENR